MAFVPGQNTLASGTGSWTLVLPPDTAIAIDDPPTRPPIPPSGVVPPQDLAAFPNIKLTIDLRNDGAHVIQINGDSSTNFPNPPDSIGFTANVEIDVINDTGHALNGLRFSLVQDAQQLPYKLVPGIIEYGETVNANYAYFTNVQAVPNQTETLYDPLGRATTPTGIAASTLSLSGPIAPGATVSTTSIIHETELTYANNFNLTITDAAATTHFLVADQTTGQSFASIGQPYPGPVAGIDDQIILVTADNINIGSTTPNVFIATGSGNDGINVSAANGNNTMDGGTGNNFLTGGNGLDTFFVDDRGPVADTWTTIEGFHSGDNATVWGLTPADFNIGMLDNQGAAGHTGLTFSITAAGKPNANLTMTGYTVADLNSGKLAVTFGRTADLPGLPGSNFMLIHGT